ncbi:MAG: GNAT family N-acetyltransferase [Cyanobacteriota bacterium]|nr:GNAT family N-acetyltransferase [Cyanobacteriota bacterium]
MSSFSVPGYQLRRGSSLDRGNLVKFMERNWGELAPDHPRQHLADTIDRYLSADTPLWWVQSQGASETVACLWLGWATDQDNGQVHPYLLLLYVSPEHRRRGIASALLEAAHDWAGQTGYRQISLQVLSHNQAAQLLYEKLGYQPQAILMRRLLC